MFRRGFRRFSRRISARGPLAFLFGASAFRPVRTGFFFSVLPWPAAFPLFAAHHLDAAKITELLLWILAFTTYVVLGVVILIRIGRSVKERKSGRFDYGGETEMFRDLYRKHLISPEEYKKIQTRLRDRLVGDVLKQSAAPAAAEGGARDEELEKILRLQALLAGQKPRESRGAPNPASPSSVPPIIYNDRSSPLAPPGGEEFRPPRGP
ncbi:MAG: hypothetical protein IKE69_11995 [Thermoguttaceae bacterium]|nr:hypothetical protein [Thermoguttaceae bacterium]